VIPPNRSGSQTWQRLCRAGQAAFHAIVTTADGHGAR
jgi:hypothetical protein